jgi:hypothetical protein
MLPPVEEFTARALRLGKNAGLCCCHQPEHARGVALGLVGFVAKNVWLGQDPTDDMPVNIGKAAVDAVVSPNEFRLLNAKQLHHGGVDILDR